VASLVLPTARAGSGGPSLGLSVVGQPALDGDLLAFLVPETDPTSPSGAGVDRNGDGDVFDYVLYAHRVSTGETSNLGLALIAPVFVFVAHRIEDPWIAMLVHESSQGRTDLNGDGDTSDLVLHVHNSSTGVTSNLGLGAAGGFTLAQGRVAFYVPEYDQGSLDLNGDGDSADSVVHLHEAAAGTTANLGLGGLGALVLGSDLLGFTVREADQGVTDLNQDGDTQDSVLHLHDVSRGTTLNTALASLAPLVDGPRAAFSVPESDQGSTDLNGDGDAQDLVLHLYEQASQSVENLQRDTSLAFPLLSPANVRMEGDRVAFLVKEASQGDTDLNGDGDTGDFVLHLHDASSGALTNLRLSVAVATGFPSPIPLHLRRDLLAFQVLESSQGNIDLNGDGDALDGVLHLHDAATGQTRNLGLASQTVALDGQRVALAVLEPLQGNTDLNGDGDALDGILHLHDPSSGATSNTGLAALDPRLDGDRLAFLVPEPSQGSADLNGDGDAGDGVAHALHVPSGAITRLDASVLFAPALVLDGDGLALAVSERSHGSRDLNGDGDALDDVVHVFRLQERDGDGIFDPGDNCPDQPSPDQGDLDGDGSGDPCDPDDDGEGIPDTADACPRYPNALPLRDRNGDQIPDDCQCGDAFPDGGLNALDARRIKQCAVGLRADCDVTLSDANGDGAVDALDARRVEQAIVGLRHSWELVCSRRPRAEMPPPLGDACAVPGVSCAP
jgi:hypothetical protein